MTADDPHAELVVMVAVCVLSDAGTRRKRDIVFVHCLVEESRVVCLAIFIQWPVAFLESVHTRWGGTNAPCPYHRLLGITTRPIQQIALRNGFLKHRIEFAKLLCADLGGLIKYTRNATSLNRSGRGSMSLDRRRRCSPWLLSHRTGRCSGRISGERKG